MHVRPHIAPPLGIDRAARTVTAVISSAAPDRASPSDSFHRMVTSAESAPTSRSDSNTAAISDGDVCTAWSADATA